MRAYRGLPVRPSQSERFTDTACTLTRISPSAGTGFTTSLSWSTSGEPYAVWTIAFTSLSFSALRAMPLRIDGRCRKRGVRRKQVAQSVDAGLNGRDDVESQRSACSELHAVIMHGP